MFSESHGLPGEAWGSPWDSLNMEFFDPNVKKEITLLRDMTVHYWNGDQLSFDLSVRAFENSVMNRVSPEEKNRVQKISMECLYNKANFFIWAKLFYGQA